jgi:hypothetical protein
MTLTSIPSNCYHYTSYQFQWQLKKQGSKYSLPHLSTHSLRGLNAVSKAVCDIVQKAVNRGFTVAGDERPEGFDRAISLIPNQTARCASAAILSPLLCKIHILMQIVP